MILDFSFFFEAGVGEKEKKNEDDLIKLREKENILEIFNQIQRKQNNRCDLIKSEKMKTKNTAEII